MVATLILHFYRGDDVTRVECGNWQKKPLKVTHINYSILCNSYIKSYYMRWVRQRNSMHASDNVFKREFILIEKNLFYRGTTQYYYKCAPASLTKQRDPDAMLFPCDTGSGFYYTVLHQVRLQHRGAKMIYYSRNNTHPKEVGEKHWHQ